MDPDLYQVGALAAILGLAIKEYFSYQKSRKNDNGNGQNKRDKEQDERISENVKNIAVMLEMVRTIKENHLVHIKEDLGRIEKDNKEWHEKTDKKLDILLNR